MSETEVAWAAGFFDGEGAVPLTMGRSGRPASPSITITQAGPEDEPPDTLLRFQAAVGVPCRIYGPTLQLDRKPRWVLQVGRYEYVVKVRDALYPYLSSAKRAAFDASFDAHREVRENRRPRSVPHADCKNGHPLIPGNLYESKGRRACRACQLERARQQRLRANVARLASTGASS